MKPETEQAIGNIITILIIATIIAAVVGGFIWMNRSIENSKINSCNDLSTLTGFETQLVSNICYVSCNDVWIAKHDTVQILSVCAKGSE